MLEFLFDSENPKDLMRRLLSKRTKVYFSNGTPDQYYKDDRLVLCNNFGSYIVWVILRILKIIVIYNQISQDSNLYQLSRNK